MPTLILFTLLIFTNLASVKAKVLYEEGYTVTTVLDGHKQNINPYSVIPRSGLFDIILLDSVNSVFYTVKLPISQNSEFKRFAGNGSFGYCDGEAEYVMFNKPKSFAVDLKGNVYVVDRSYRTIRKISSSGGVTTIAGGRSKKPGREDGPAQSASFSDDFQLAFVPEICALLISDHGNQLLRQIDLKPEDCRPQSSNSLGAVSVWVLVAGVTLSCLIGLTVGIVIRPYVIPCEGSSALALHKTWKHYLISLVNQAVTLCFVIRSAVVSQKLYSLLLKLFRLSLSHLSLMFGISIVRNTIRHKESVSLFDSDVSSSYEVPKSLTYADQLKDLLSSDESVDYPALTDEVNARVNRREEIDCSVSDIRKKIDSMMQGNLLDFADAAKETSASMGS